jgi:sarcosine oxidase subunit gamma
MKVAVTRVPRQARLIVRGGAATAALVGRAFGLALPCDPCRAATGDRRAALWLGPDEWLVLAPDGDGERLAAALAQAAGSEPVSVVDVSHRQVGLAVAGRAAADAINGFNALDLDEHVFPVGLCTRTLFAKAEIVLWRRERETFRIEVGRSFAPYVLGCLAAAIDDPSLPG